MAHRRGLALLAALAALGGAAGIAPAAPVAEAPGMAAPAPELGALAPGREACPGAVGPLTVAEDLSGFGVRSAGGPPILLSLSRLAYLQTKRRPVPHVAAVVASTTAGAVLWRDPVALTADPTALAAAGSLLDVALRAGAGVRLEALSPADGAVRIARSLDWPAAGPAPALTPDGRGGLIVSGPVSNLPAALSGLGVAATPVADLTASLAARWRDDGVGDLLALGGSVAITGVRQGTSASRVRLMALSLRTGGVLWTHTLVAAGPPATASFGVSEGVLVWALTWPGGGSAGAFALATGKALWRVPNTLADWIAAGGAAIAGPAPWQAPSALVARSLASGAVLWQGPAAAPVALLGGRLLTVSAAAAGSLGWLWLTPPVDRSPAARALAARPSQGAAPAPLPPVAVYCASAGTGATLLAPARPGLLWTVGPGALQTVPG
jgi:hypothetical protein